MWPKKKQQKLNRSLDLFSQYYLSMQYLFINKTTSVHWSGWSIARILQRGTGFSMQLESYVFVMCLWEVFYQSFHEAFKRHAVISVSPIVDDDIRATIAKGEKMGNYPKHVHSLEVVNGRIDVTNNSNHVVWKPGKEVV